MRIVLGIMALVGWSAVALAQTPAPTAPGPAATERVLDPTKPAAIAPGATPPAPPAQMGGDEMRALLDAARETAKATRENVEYNRVVPDILTQILTKLDKIEDKLDRIDGALRQGARRR